MKHYRVDKMAEIQLLDAPREGNEQFQKLDMADYSRKVFSMFGGEEELVRLRFKDHLIGVVMDRFGKDVTIFRKEGGYFETVSYTHLDVYKRQRRWFDRQPR